MAKWLTLEKKERNKRVSFLRYFIGCIVMILFYTVFHNGFSPINIQMAIQTWGDAFVMTSILMLAVVAIIKFDRIGYLDWISYSLKTTKFVLSRAKDKEFIGYTDFIINRERGIMPIWPGLVTASLCLFIGIIISVLFYFV